MRRIGAGRRHIALHFRAAMAVRNLEMTDGNVGRLQRRRNARQPAIRVGLIENEIAYDYEVDVSHAAKRERRRGSEVPGMPATG